MVLKMLADTRKFDLDVDIRSLQNVLRSNTAEKKHLGATDGATCKNDFLVDLDCLLRRILRARVLDAGCCEPVGARSRAKEQTSDGGVSEDVKVRAWREGVDVRRARVRTGPVGGVNGRSRDESAPTLAAIGVRRERNADIREGLRPVTHDGDDAACWSASEAGRRPRGAYYPGYETCTGPCVPWLAVSYMMFPSALTASLGAVKVSDFFISANMLFQFHLSLPPEIMLAHASTSIFDGRTAYMPLTADEPPRTLPRGHPMTRLFALGCATVW